MPVDASHPRSPARSRNGSQRFDRPLARHLVTVAALLLSLGLATPSAQAASLHLSDGVDDLDSLPIGRSLVARATGLPADAEVTLVLRDQPGAEIVSLTTQAGPNGELPDTLLWLRTGISGCDCELLPHGYPFRDAEEAIEKIFGQFLEVVILDAAGSTLVSTSIEVVIDWDPTLFIVDTNLCPRGHLDVVDDAFLLSTTAATEPVRVFLVPHRPTWHLGDAFADVRPGFPEGQLLEPTGSPWLEPLWLGVESIKGGYDLIIRHGIAESLVLGPMDAIQNQPLAMRKPLASEGGLVIDDWDCRSHDDQ